jgi:hypothetical protein
LALASTRLATMPRTRHLTLVLDTCGARGYYYPVGPRSVWHDGFWSRPPYVGPIGWPLATTNTGYWERRHWDRGDDRWEHTGGTSTIATTTNSECQTETCWPTFHYDGRQY